MERRPDNSKLVRLKGHYDTVRHGTLQFQFQTGSIKSVPFPTMVSMSMLFQFQTGSIKSMLDLIVIATMTFAAFQFQTGSIKRVSNVNTCGVTSSRKFQFQTGSIKSTSAPRHLHHLVSFNSKLVRLKADRHPCNSRCKECFNSKLVRLKDRLFG